MCFDPELLVSCHMYILAYMPQYCSIVHTYLHSIFVVHVRSYVCTFVVGKFRVIDTPVSCFVFRCVMCCYAD